MAKGWKFPIEVDATTGKIKMTEDERQDIEESIKVLLLTSVGERVMRYNYGSHLAQYTFGRLNETSLHLVKSQVEQAIRKWEPRVKDLDVMARTNPEEGKVHLTIQYSTYTNHQQYVEVSLDF